MTSQGRNSILASIRNALRDGPTASLPEIVERTVVEADAAALLEKFTKELHALGGTATVVGDRASCGMAIGEYAKTKGIQTIACAGAPNLAEISPLIGGVDIVAASGKTMPELAHIDCSLVWADALFADTGSALIISATRQDQVLPYIARTCIVVSTTASLVPALSDQTLSPLNEALERGFRGEAVIVTGPSRTADIEKKLVLGAHGPEALAVFIIENNQAGAF